MIFSVERELQKLIILTVLFMACSRPSRFVKKDFHGLCFVNLVDFDALWGHRRNPEGYGHEIEKFDKGLGTLMKELREDDLSDSDSRSWK